jgi:hypothetical protein
MRGDSLGLFTWSQCLLCRALQGKLLTCLHHICCETKHLRNVDVAKAEPTNLSVSNTC